MVFLIIGISIIGLKIFGVVPFAELEWYFLPVPFACALIWYEIIEPLIGWDLKQQKINQAKFDQKLESQLSKNPMYRKMKKRRPR